MEMMGFIEPHIIGHESESGSPLDRTMDQLAASLSSSWWICDGLGENCTWGLRNIGYVGAANNVCQRFGIHRQKKRIPYS